jgi:hypothetical protein
MFPEETYRSTLVASDWREDGPADQNLPEHSGNQSPNGMKYTTSISTRLLYSTLWHRQDMVVAYARPDLTCHGFIIIPPTPGPFSLFADYLPVATALSDALSHCVCLIYVIQVISRSIVKWNLLPYLFQSSFYTNAFLRCHTFVLITPPLYPLLTRSNTVASRKHKWPYFLSSKEARQTPWSHCPRTMTTMRVVGPARYIVIFDRSDWPQ